MFTQIGSQFSHFGVELDVDLFSFPEDDGVFQMEMDQDDHFVVAGLIESMGNVRIEQIDLVTAHGRVTKAIGVRFECPVDFLIGQARSDVQIFQLRIDFTRIQYESVLLDDALETANDQTWRFSERSTRRTSICFRSCS